MITLQTQFSNTLIRVDIYNNSNSLDVWSWQFQYAQAIVDVSPPIELAQRFRPETSFLPGDDISIVFNEEIDCSKLSVMGRLSDGSVLDQSNFLVLCSLNQIFLDFLPTMTVSVSF